MGSKRRGFVRPLAAIGSAAAWVAFLHQSGSRQAGAGLESLDSHAAAAAATGTVRAESAYTRRDGPTASEYPFLQDATLVEPHRDTTLTALLPASEAELCSRKGCQFDWSITSSRTGEVQTASSLDAGLGVHTTTFEAPGRYTVEVRATPTDGNGPVAVARTRLVCKYVRRELRSLLATDREAYFAAAKLLWQTPTEEGQRLYGGRFKGIEYFAREHNTLAGQRECDHMHDGLGFLTQHAAMTMEYEQALQAIDASTSVPYWDYTIEAGYVTTGGGDMREWFASEVFDDDWFGEASPEGYVVRRGRWANTPVTRPSGEFATVTNAFGYLRAPWNQNKVPFVTRHNASYGYTLDSPPSCADHVEQMKLTTFEAFGSAISYKPHGKTHTLIGGVWGADWAKVFEDLDFSFRKGRDLSTLAFVVQKAMWRAKLLECPSYCSAETSTVECKCVCPKLSEWLETEPASAVLAKLSGAPGVLEGMFTDPAYLKNAAGDDISPTLLKLFCNDLHETAPITGDSLESASPTDISFWSIHPTIERLWIWRRILGMDDERWPSNSSSSVNGLETGRCWGHDAEDAVYWKHLTGEQEVDQDGGTEEEQGQGVRPYTNRELYEMMDPATGAAPFVYDSFSWRHCVDEGYSATLVDETGEGDSGGSS